jgi:hypothetical protein
MYIIKALSFLVAAVAVTQASPVNKTDSDSTKREDCGDSACVQYFADGGYTSGRMLGEYQPTCKGNCFQYNR